MAKKLSREARLLAHRLAGTGDPWYYIAQELRCTIAELQPVAKELGRDPIAEDEQWRAEGRARGELWGADAEGALATEPQERLAALAHEQWSGWMEYLFKKCKKSGLGDGSLLIPAELVKRWRRQMETPFHALPQEERESDRAEARRVLQVLRETDKADQ